MARKNVSCMTKAFENTSRVLSSKVVGGCCDYLSAISHFTWFIFSWRCKIITLFFKHWNPFDQYVHNLHLSVLPSISPTLNVLIFTYMSLEKSCTKLFHAKNARVKCLWNRDLVKRHSFGTNDVSQYVVDTLNSVVLFQFAKKFLQIVVTFLSARTSHDVHETATSRHRNFGINVPTASDNFATLLLMIFWHVFVVIFAVVAWWSVVNINNILWAVRVETQKLPKGNIFL